MTILLSAFVIVWGLFLWVCHRALRSQPVLESLPTVISNSSVSVVIAVRNGGMDFEKSLQALLKENSRIHEVIVVDDRSSDLTADILMRLKAEYKYLKSVRVEALPDGWLGKVHALHLGSSEASGEFILFADADIRITSELIERARGVSVALNLDHLAVLPIVNRQGPGVDLLMATSVILFTMSARPWLSIEEKPLESVKGVGAFNFVRRKTLTQSEGFPWLRMEVADDVALAQLIARQGRSLFVRSPRLGPRLDWYGSLPEMFRGLEKNSVGGFTNYRLILMLLVPLVSVTPVLIPLLGFIFGTSGERLPIYLFFFETFLFALTSRRFTKYPFWILCFFPVGIFLLALALLRASLICLRRGGIMWSGSFYSIKALRDGVRVRLGI